MLEQAFQQRRNQVNVRDCLLGYQANEIIGILLSAWFGNNDSRAPGKGQKYLKDGSIETERGLLQDTVCRG